MTNLILYKYTDEKQKVRNKMQRQSHLCHTLKKKKIINIK